MKAAIRILEIESSMCIDKLKKLNRLKKSSPREYVMLMPFISELENRKEEILAALVFLKKNKM